MRPAFPRAAALAALLALAALAGCQTVREVFQKPPEGRPSGREGWLVYSVGALSMEGPAAWRASGGARHLVLESGDGGAKLEVSTPDAPFPDEAACLADAEQVMKRGDGMERVRRHPTKFAGARALGLEGDSGGWHVWAWAACDGGTAYQVFFTARTPPSAEVLDAYRTLVASARIGGVS
jgi:hypothetical protein